MIDIVSKIKDILSTINKNTEIVEIFKTGSQLFRDKPGDLDYVVICKDFPENYKRLTTYIDGNKYDLFFQSIEDYTSLLDVSDSNNDLGYGRTILFNYLYSIRQTIYGNWENTWDILDHKDSYKRKLKELYYNTIGKRISRNNATKGWVHYYIILKIFENNSLEISSEMLEDINTLYTAKDGEAIPIIEWIESQINKI